MQQLKTWSAAGLLLAGSSAYAAAPKLYTVTVTTEDFRPGMTLGILPMDKANEKYFQKIAAKTATFKVPAGKYSVSLMQTQQSEKQNKFATPVFKDIVVKANTSVKIKAEYLPAIPISDSGIIDKHLIMMSALMDSCEKPAVNMMCATSSISVEALAAAVGVIPEMKQKYPWSKYYETGRLGLFDINGRAYTLILDRQEGSTRIIWQRTR